MKVEEVKVENEEREQEKDGEEGKFRELDCFNYLLQEAHRVLHGCFCNRLWQPKHLYFLPCATQFQVDVVKLLSENDQINKK